MNLNRSHVEVGMHNLDRFQSESGQEFYVTKECTVECQQLLHSRTEFARLCFIVRRAILSQTDPLFSSSRNIFYRVHRFLFSNFL